MFWTEESSNGHLHVRLAEGLVAAQSMKLDFSRVPGWHCSPKKGCTEPMLEDRGSWRL